MRYRIRHTTEYIYQETVSTGHNRLCLVPLNLPEQKCLSSNVTVYPSPDELTYRTDFFGNTLLFISIYKEHGQLEIDSESLVDIEDRILAGRALGSPVLWKGVKEQIYGRVEVYADVIQYTLPSIHVPYSEEIRKFAWDCFPEDATLWGGCQDFAHLMIACLRNIGLPARYVSGYIETMPPPGKEKLVGSDASHAWVAVYFPEIGWVE